MTVEYKFADGTVSEVEVSEEIGTYIMDLHRTRKATDPYTEREREVVYKYDHEHTVQRKI